MQSPRSVEYSKLCLDIFLMEVAEIEEELLQLAQLRPNPLSVYNGDVTYAEYEFLLLTERDFKVNCMGKPTDLSNEIEAFLADA